MEYRNLIQMEIDGMVRATGVMEAEYSPEGFRKMVEALDLAERDEWDGGGAGYYYRTADNACFFIFTYRSFSLEEDDETCDRCRPDFKAKAEMLEQIARAN